MKGLNSQEQLQYKIKKLLDLQLKEISLDMRMKLIHIKKLLLNFLKFMNSYLNKQKMAQLLMKMMLILLMCRNRIIRVLQSANKLLDSVPDDSRRDDDLPKLEIDKFSGDAGLWNTSSLFQF